jgi:hypothetical protein
MLLVCSEIWDAWKASWGVLFMLCVDTDTSKSTLSTFQHGNGSEKVTPLIFY